MWKRNVALTLRGSKNVGEEERAPPKIYQPGGTCFIIFPYPRPHQQLAQSLPTSRKLSTSGKPPSNVTMRSATPTARATAPSLPTELWLNILRHLPPQDLFHTLRLVDSRSYSCSNDIFLHELLPSLEIRIHVSLASEYPLRPGGHAQIVFGFDHVDHTASSLNDRGVETAWFSLRHVVPSSRTERALVKLQQDAHVDAVTDWQVFEMCLPPGEALSMHGRAWHNFVVGPSHARVDVDMRDDESGGRLRLDWRKLMSAYLSKSSDVDVEGI